MDLDYGFRLWILNSGYLTYIICNLSLLVGQARVRDGDVSFLVPFQVVILEKKLQPPHIGSVLKTNYVMFFKYKSFIVDLHGYKFSIKTSKLSKMIHCLVVLQQVDSFHEEVRHYSLNVYFSSNTS